MWEKLRGASSEQTKQGDGRPSGPISGSPDRHAHQALDLDDQALDLILDAAPDATVICDRHGIIVRANAQVERMLGYSREELLGQPVELLIPPGEREAHEGQRKAYARDPQPRPLASGLDLRAQRKDGTVLPVEVSLGPIQRHGGLWVYAAIRDITGRVKAEEERLRAARADAAREEAEESRRRFALLAEASRCLSVALDEREGLSSVGRLLVPDIADLVAVSLAGGAPPVVIHAQPERAQAVGSALQRASEAGGLIRSVMWSGEAVRYEDVGDPERAALGSVPADDDLLRAIAPRSLVLVPLYARDDPVGVLVVATLVGERRLDSEALELLADLGRRCAYAVANRWLLRATEAQLNERERAERALAAEKERQVVTLQSIADGVIATDTEARVTLMNPIAESLTGRTLDRALGRPLSDVLTIVKRGTGAVVASPVDEVLRTREPAGMGGGIAVVSAEGARRSISISVAPIRQDDDESAVGAAIVLHDVTDAERFEAELQRSDRLESLGVLAGGIAHDFNNLLTAILGSISLAVARPGNAGQLRKRLETAERAALRARELTKQLLAFSKGGAPIRAPSSVEELVRESVTFALTGTNVRGAFRLAAGIDAANIDAAQVGLVLQNLAINAVHAMPEGGELIVSAENITVRSDNALPLEPGPYVRVVVQDQGTGIPQELLPRIFDPFFTTKATGSGLGLATAYAVIRKHGGHLTVDSQPGRGATFALYLPSAKRPIQRRGEGASPLTGKGRLLVLDDEPMMREAAQELLGSLGYEVHTVATGPQVVDCYGEAMQSGAPYDAVILDLTVPGGMGGKEVVLELLRIDPAARAIVSSGYSDDPVMAEHAQHGFKGVLAKPYTVTELSETLHRVLG